MKNEYILFNQAKLTVENIKLNRKPNTFKCMYLTKTD